MLESVNAYLITRATRDDAFAAAHWIVGSLNGRGWDHAHRQQRYESLRARTA